MPGGYEPYYSIARGTTVSTIGSPADIGASTEDMAMQITITGNVTVVVKASQNNMDWENVSVPTTGYTASTIIMLDRRVAFYRADATVVSGTVEAVVGYGRGRHGELLNAGPTTTPTGFAIGQIDVSGFVPTSHQFTATLPLRVNGGALADLTTNPTAYTLLMAGTTNRGILVYDSVTGGFKVQPATVDDAGNAIASSFVSDGQIATTTQLYTAGTLQLVRQNITLANGDNNNVNLGTPAPTVRSALIHIVGPSGAYAITGFRAPTNGASDVLIVQDTTGQTLTFKNLTTSSAGNQILTGTGGNVVASIAMFVYDTDTGRWVMLSAPATAATLPVLLQASTPGVTQTGNFNVNGAGLINTITTTAVSGDVAYSGTSMALTGQLALTRGAVTLANGDNHNVNRVITAVEHSHIHITGPTGAFATTGFTAPTSQGALLFVYNTTAQVWTIKNNTGSSAGNKINTLSGADVVLPASTSFAAFIYDTNAAEWVLMYAGAGGGGGGAPTGAQYLTGASDAGLSAERVVTDTATVTWDLATATQAKANVPDASITYAKIQDVSAISKLLGRGAAAGAGDVEEITLGTNLSMSATTLNATGGMTAQDQIDLAWDKAFFSGASVLPATERVAASLVTVPTEAGSISGTTFTKLQGHATIAGTTRAFTYWDLGALRSEVLFVVTATARHTGNNTALFLTAAAPASVSPDGYYIHGSASTDGGAGIYKCVSNSFTKLSSDPAHLLASTGTQNNFGIAVYYNDSTGALKEYLRLNNRWILVNSVTDSTYTTMRYVSFVNDGNETGRLILPMAAWSD